MYVMMEESHASKRLILSHCSVLQTKTGVYILPYAILYDSSQPKFLIL